MKRVLAYDELTDERDLRRQAVVLVRPSGRRRDSSIVGIYRDALRHKDGALTVAYQVETPATMFADDALVDIRYDDLARMLAFDKPSGTLVQFRYSTTPDLGQAITNVITSRALAGTHTLASLLQASNLDYLRGTAQSLPYRRSVLTMWIRVPPKKRGNPTMSALADFGDAFRQEMREQGILSTLRGLGQIYSRTADDSVVRRTLEAEQQAYNHANRVWRLFENSSPLSLRRFTRQEIWEAVFYGHCQNSNSSPILPDRPGRDLRDFLCGETVEGELNYLMHGEYPVTIVSMFIPPNEFVTADALRSLIGRRDFNLRHTIVTEYLFPEQRKETKRLDRRIKQVKRTFTRKDNPEGAAALRSLRAVREEVAGARESLLPTRFYVLLYGERARNLSELKQSVEVLDEQCERVVSAIRQIPGANADREEPEALRALFATAIAGELSPGLTGRELTEVANSVVALTPTEDSWQGATRPHTLLSTVTGRLVGIDLFDRNQIPSPLIQIIAAPRGGKSILMAQFACDILASLSDASVNAIDIGETLLPLATVLGGRYIRPRPDEVRAINIWSYPELKDGEMPDDVQKALVVGDLKMLARVRDDDKTAEDIISAVVAQVYENIVSQNGPGRPLFEPVLSHFIAQLRTYPFDAEIVRERRETLVLALNNYIGHPWLDAPTHPDYEEKSPFDVFELGSLRDFPNDIKLSLAYRIAAYVARSIGRRRADGTRAPTANLFDEMWEIKDEYPFIFKVLQHAGRKGPKENSITILATHAFEDIEDVASLSKTGNVIFVGKQLGDFSKIVAHAKLSENGATAISHIKTAPGRFSQFVMVIGTGPDQVVELVQHELSPLMLWTLTTNADERNARSLVSAYYPDWSETQVHAWLAQHYPRGLTAVGLREIDETLLEVAA
ncbi:MAG TPA: hypothetical protein VLL54_14185 [Pyrinomonadaceae bacterium]|nr:hypothetical protein [Pyrinomonadaceae bacterium]